MYLVLVGGIGLMVAGYLGRGKESREKLANVFKSPWARKGSNWIRWKPRLRFPRFIKKYSGILLIGILAVLIAVPDLMDKYNLRIMGAKTSFHCGGKQYCSEMKNCAEAQFYLHKCGVTSLDRDGDGTGCDRLCR